MEESYESDRNYPSRSQALETNHEKLTDHENSGSWNPSTEGTQADPTTIRTSTSGKRKKPEALVVVRCDLPKRNGGALCGVWCQIDMWVLLQKHYELYRNVCRTVSMYFKYQESMPGTCLGYLLCSKWMKIHPQKRVLNFPTFHFASQEIMRSFKFNHTWWLEDWKKWSHICDA